MLHEDCRFALVKFLGKLLRPLGLWVYAYPKAGNTSTVVLFFDGGKTVLAIRRKKDPQKGKLAFPGGFLEVGEETAVQCAMRELAEETGIVSLDASELVLCDERSDPNRDVRGPIIDFGYYAVVPDNRRDEITCEILAGDDAAEVLLMSVTELKGIGLAFDHDLLLDHALFAAGIDWTN